jgi:hypothetical protein
MNTEELTAYATNTLANVQALETLLTAVMRGLPEVAQEALRKEISLALESATVTMLNSPVQDEFREEVARNLRRYAGALHQ